MNDKTIKELDKGDIILFDERMKYMYYQQKKKIVLEERSRILKIIKQHDACDNHYCFVKGYDVSSCLEAIDLKIKEVEE